MTTCNETCKENCKPLQKSGQLITPHISQSWGVLIKFCWQMWAYAVSLLSINQTFTKMQRVTLRIGGFLLTSWMEETFFIVDIISHNYLICKWEEKKMKVKTEVETATWNLNDKESAGIQSSLPFTVFVVLLCNGMEFSLTFKFLCSKCWFYWYEMQKSVSHHSQFSWNTLVTKNRQDWWIRRLHLYLDLSTVVIPIQIERWTLNRKGNRYRHMNQC